MSDFYRVTELQIQNIIAILLFSIAFSQLVYGLLLRGEEYFDYRWEACFNCRSYLYN